MDERFDRLEQMIGELGSQVKTVETRLGARIDGVEAALGTRIDGVEEKIGGLSGELRAVETRLRGHIEDVDAHMSPQDQRAPAGCEGRLQVQCGGRVTRSAVAKKEQSTCVSLGNSPPSRIGTHIALEGHQMTMLTSSPHGGLHGQHPRKDS